MGHNPKWGCKMQFRCRETYWLDKREKIFIRFTASIAGFFYYLMVIFVDYVHLYDFITDKNATLDF